jgi:hypothetical protein
VQGYCVVLLPCGASALGLLYLALLTWLLGAPPRRGRFRAREPGGADPSPLLHRVMLGVPGGAGPPRRLRRAVALADSPAPQWLPLWALALAAAAHFAAQAALPAAAALPPPLRIPDRVLDFFEEALGVSADARGGDLALHLLRPGALLLGAAVYRWLYCLGALHRQLQGGGLGLGGQGEGEGQERRRLRKQLGAAALLRRLAILHASKLVAVLAFAAAMKRPGGLGWALVAGCVLFPPLLGTARSGAGAGAGAAARRRPALAAALAAAQALAAAWLLLQYAVGVTWLAQALEEHPGALDALRWLGVDAGGAAAAPPGALERLLRLKALLLVAVALQRRAMRWHAKLPAPVREAAQCGAACPLFWPPAPEVLAAVGLDAADVGAAGAEGGAASPAGSPRAAAHPSLLQSARVVVGGAVRRAQRVTAQALRAVDWPAPAPAPAPGAPQPSPRALGGSSRWQDDQESTSDDESVAGLRFYSPAGAPPPPPPPPPLEAAAAAGREPPPAACDGAARRRSLRFAAQDFLERWFLEWGLDAALLGLLFSAFVAANALSLLQLAAVAVGMGLPPRARQDVWRWAAVPLLGAALLGQYSLLLVGAPPAGALRAPRAGLGVSDDVAAWLGMCRPDPGELWALALAYSLAVLQLHCDAWARSALGAPGRGAAALPRPASRPPLLLGARAPAPRAAALWAPLALAAQPAWGWHDWARYNVYRRYLDFLLVAVVALCTADNDLLHAGYLALALLFFRSRLALRARRNALFRALPLYNLLVIAVALAYQAPFEDVFKWDWPLHDGRVSLDFDRPRADGSDRLKEHGLLLLRALAVGSSRVFLCVCW